MIDEKLADVNDKTPEKPEDINQKLSIQELSLSEEHKANKNQINKGEQNSDSDESDEDDDSLNISEAMGNIQIGHKS